MSDDVEESAAVDDPYLVVEACAGHVQLLTFAFVSSILECARLLCLGG